MGTVLVLGAGATSARVADAQGGAGTMSIHVSVDEQINPIAVVRPAKGIRVVTDAQGAYGQVRFGIESDMPMSVSVRLMDGSDVPDVAALASRIRLIVGAATSRTGPTSQWRALPSGANEIGVDFNWPDFGDASRGTLELAATEVRITAYKGDAEVTVIAFLPAVTLDVRPKATVAVFRLPSSG